MRGLIQKQYSKPCRYCAAPCILWDEVHKYFADPDGSKHSCPPSAKQNQNEKLNATINDLRLELDSKFDALRNDLSSQQSSTQKAIANCKTQLNELYELFKVHKCWISD